MARLSIFLVLRLFYIQCCLAFTAQPLGPTTITVGESFTIQFQRDDSDPDVFTLRLTSSGGGGDIAQATHDSNGIKDGIAAIQCKTEGTFFLDIFSDTDTSSSILLSLPDLITVVSSGSEGDGDSTSGSPPGTAPLSSASSGNASATHSDATSTNTPGLPATVTVTITPSTPATSAVGGSSISSKSQVALLAGGIIGGILLPILFVLCSAVYLRHRRRAQRRKEMVDKFTRRFPNARDDDMDNSTPIAFDRAWGPADKPPTRGMSTRPEYGPTDDTLVAAPVQSMSMSKPSGNSSRKSRLSRTSSWSERFYAGASLHSQDHGRGQNHDREEIPLEHWSSAGATEEGGVGGELLTVPGTLSDIISRKGTVRSQRSMASNGVTRALEDSYAGMYKSIYGNGPGSSSESSGFSSLTNPEEGQLFAPEKTFRPSHSRSSSGSSVGTVTSIEFAQPGTTTPPPTRILGLFKYHPPR